MDPSQMSPEQMAAMAKEQCIFCHIVTGRVASRKVYEDEKVVAVLDINPANPGHILLMTKEHYVVMPQIPDDVVTHIGMVTKALSHALLRALKAQGTTIFVANGVTAGQRAQHFMLHIIPRMENDGIGIDYPEHSISEADYKKLLAALKKGIAKTLGKEEEPEEEEKEEKKVIEAEEVEEEAEEKEEEKEEEETEEDEAEEESDEEETEEDEGDEEETEEAEEKEGVELDALVEAAKTAKPKKAKKEEPEEEDEDTEDEEEPEEETEEDEERKKLDKIADMFT